MSFSTAIDGVIAAVRALTPTWEPLYTFTCYEDAEGYVVPLEELSDDALRAFDVRMAGPPVDDGGTGWQYTRYRAEIELRVLYPAQYEVDRGRLERMIAQDVADITSAIVHPSNFGAGVESIAPPTATRRETLTNPQGQTVGTVIVLPFSLYYLHT